MPDIIHIEPSENSFQLHFLFVLVPVIVFALLVTFFATNSPKQYAASTQGPVVLGDETK